jgi:CheY-like chemotaxis protein
MITCEEFEQQLRDALTHLYDPDYRPPEPLCITVGCDPLAGPLEIKSALMREIGAMAPPPGLPPDARPRQIYELLYNRFVLRLTQEETAERLNISVATAWRIQKEAIHELARRIWEQTLGQPKPAEEKPGAQAADWRAQAESELASLLAGAPDVRSDVAEVINGVVGLWNLPDVGGSVRLVVEFVQSGLVAAVHPVALRQVLIAAVRRLAACMSSGEIKIFATLVEGNVTINLVAPIAKASQPDLEELTQNLLAPKEISITAQLDNGYIFWHAGLPSLGRVTVLVADDNPDMVEFYRRSTEGTRYRIISTARGRSLLEVATATVPDIIVLDVMLPDVDGWELLLHLREHPATRHIPVIVCSVIKDEELARSLGAALYLAKPVRPGEFVEALDRVLAQASKPAAQPPTSNATAC